MYSHQPLPNPTTGVHVTPGWQTFQFVHVRPPQATTAAEKTKDATRQKRILLETSQTSRKRQKRAPTVHAHSGQLVEGGLERLPSEIILMICTLLSISDVLCLSQVSKLCYNICNTMTIWKRLAFDYQLRARPLHITDFEDPEHLPFARLKRAVLSAHFLERNWSSAEPRQIPSPHSSIPTALNMSQLDCFCYAMKFTSRYLLLPTRDGNLVGWDIVRNAEIGHYRMNGQTGHRSILINVRIEYKERSLYCIIGKVMPPLDHNEMQFSVLHIKFPEEGDSQITSEPPQLQFNTLTQFIMPRCRIIELHILDPKTRTIGVLFLCQDTNTIGLYIIFDWDSGITTMTNTGLPFKFRRTVITLRSSACGGYVTVHSELDGYEQYRTYSLDSLRDSCGVIPWRPMLAPTYPIIHSAEVASRSGSFRWTAGSEELDQSMIGRLPLRVWTLRQWWPVMMNVPERYSRIILYMKLGPAGAQWKVAQYYSTPNGAVDSGCRCRSVFRTDRSYLGNGFESHAQTYDSNILSTSNIHGMPTMHHTTSAQTAVSPSQSNLAQARPTIGTSSEPVVCRYTADIKNPQLLPNGDPALPLIAISFNHVGWIELVPTTPTRSNNLNMNEPSNPGADEGTETNVNIVNLQTNSTSLPAQSVHTDTQNTRRQRTYKRRVFRMITFPDPDTCPCPGRSIDGGRCSNYREGDSQSQKDSCSLQPRVSTLDIPSRVLSKACHLIIDSTTGSILVTTTAKELYTYRYVNPAGA